MNKIKIFTAVFGLASMLGLQSCLDFDNPSDEFSQTEVKQDDVIYHGDADNIDYKKVASQEDLDQAIKDLTPALRTAKGGLYAMRGGKDGAVPGEHSYQRQFTLGPDNYAQMAVVPHHDFMYGELPHVYSVSKDFNPGPYSCYGIAKNAFAPLLNRPEVDSVPEVKALFLLMFNYASQEVADLYGPFPYVDYKNNKVDAPFTYNDLRTIYVNMEANVDTVINCLKYFKEKPDWYQKTVKKELSKYFNDWNEAAPTEVDTWIRFANSFKLRLAMHIVKADPAMAKKWAEEAVADGVIETTAQEICIKPFNTGFDHPLSQIAKWGDCRLSASFESLLMSLNHPYAKYLFDKNSSPIVNPNTGEVLEANTRVVGIREGTEPGQGQSVGTNTYIAYSMVSVTALSAYGAPLYLAKLSEVDFLRAEGALRGWNMGGTAEFFYNRGIDNGYLEDRNVGSPVYEAGLAEYKELQNAVPYTWHDPQGIDADMESTTKIGVKWSEGDSKEVKLEKIITQKYIAAYPYSYEAWVDMRRTGYPKLFPVLHPENGDGSLKDGDIIRRMPFALTDDASIQDIATSGLDALGGPDLQATRLWWDVAGVENF